MKSLKSLILLKNPPPGRIRSSVLARVIFAPYFLSCRMPQVCMPKASLGHRERVGVLWITLLPLSSLYQSNEQTDIECPLDAIALLVSSTCA